MNDSVAELIGLPFRHFTRCVILPQGEFAQFLHDKPSDRQDLLVKLLDLGVYERMRRRAAQLADEKANEVALDVRMIEQYGDCTREALDEATAELKAIGELRKQLADAEPRAAELQAAVEGAVAAAQRAGRVVSLLREVARAPGRAVVASGTRSSRRCAARGRRCCRKRPGTPSPRPRQRRRPCLTPPRSRPHSTPTATSATSSASSSRTTRRSLR